MKRLAGAVLLVALAVTMLLPVTGWVNTSPDVPLICDGSKPGPPWRV